MYYYLIIRYPSSYLFQCYLLALVRVVEASSCSEWSRKKSGESIYKWNRRAGQKKKKDKSTPTKEFQTYQAGRWKIKLIILCPISSWWLTYLSFLECPVLTPQWQWPHAAWVTHWVSDVTVTLVPMVEGVWVWLCFRSSLDVKPVLYMLELTWPSLR